MRNADEPVCSASEKAIDRRCAHLGRQDPVICCWCTAPLQMTKNGDTGFNVQSIFDCLGNCQGSASPLCYEDDAVLITRHAFTNICQVVRNLWDDGPIRAAGQTGISGNGTQVPPHHFYYKHPRLLSDKRRSSVFYPVNDFYDHADSRIKPNGCIRTRDVVIDGARNSDHLKVWSSQACCAAERPVPAYDDKGIQTCPGNLLSSLTPSLLCAEPS